MNETAWNAFADQYHEKNPVRITTIMQLFSSLLPDGARVLDVGCGTGVPVDAYLVAQGFTVTGVDLSYRIIELARVNVPVAT